MDSGWEMGQEMTGTAFGGCMGFGGHAAVTEGYFLRGGGKYGEPQFPLEWQKHGLGRVYRHSRTDFLR